MSKLKDDETVTFIPATDAEEGGLPEAVEIDLGGALEARPDDASEGFVGVADQIARMAYVHQYVPTTIGQAYLEAAMVNLLVLHNTCLTEHMVNAQKRMGVVLTPGGRLAPPLMVVNGPNNPPAPPGTTLRDGPIIRGPWGQ